MLLPIIAWADCPEPRSSTSSASRPYFSYSFASLAIHGIHWEAESEVTPQRNFLSGLSWARAVPKISNGRTTISQKGFRVFIARSASEGGHVGPPLQKR